MTMAAPDKEWPWFVKGFYHTGEEAFATRHRTEASRDIEIQAAHRRPDVVRVETGKRYIASLNPKSPRL